MGSPSKDAYNILYYVEPYSTHVSVTAVLIHIKSSLIEASPCVCVHIYTYVAPVVSYPWAAEGTA